MMPKVQGKPKPKETTMFIVDYKTITMYWVTMDRPTFEGGARQDDLCVQKSTGCKPEYKYQTLSAQYYPLGSSEGCLRNY